MKNITIAASLVMIAMLSCLTQAALVHHWKLDDAVSSGSTVVNSVSGLNGVTSTSGVSSVAGKIGKAFLFDGVTTAAGGEVILNNFSTTGLQSMTVTLWVKPDQNTLPAGAGVLKRLIGGSDWFEVVVQTNSDKVANNLYIGGGTYPISVGVLNDTTPAWTHIAMTAQVSGTTVTTKIYLNGVLDTPAANYTYTAWPTPPATTGQLKFAMRTGANNNGHFKGAMDDIRIYNTVLTDAEVKLIYDSANSGTTNPSPADNALGVTSPVNFSWDSLYVGAGKVSQYTLYMDADEAKVSQGTPPAGLLISGVAVTPALTSPFTGTYTYTTPLINDLDYFWRADTLIYEPNYNVPDPNFPLYNIPVKLMGGIYSFTGPLSVPLLTELQNAIVQPDPQTHVFGNTDGVFTTNITCSVPLTTVQWFKEGSATPLVDDNVNYDIQFSQTQTTLTVINAVTADDGKYYCKVFTANTSAESNHAILYRQVILKHRYSFNGDLVDSIGGANGTLINNGGTWASVSSSELVLANTGQVSGDANSINTAGGYVQLPANLIRPMGDYGTFVVWFTSTDAANTAGQRLFAFGDPGAQPFNANNYQCVSLQSNAQMAFHTDGFGAGNATTTNSGTTVATANTQFCLVGRFNGATNTQTVFINGVEKGNSMDVAAFDFYGLTDTTNYIGRSMNPTQPLFIGNINELRIYDIPLTPEWIKAIYEAGPDNLNANPCNTPQKLDFSGDCIVDIDDFAIFAQNWLYCGRLICN